MTTDWYTACLSEVAAFVDKFETRDTVRVRHDSDLVAALVGILQAQKIIYAMGKHAEAGLIAATLLETELRPQDAQ